MFSTNRLQVCKTQLQGLLANINTRLQVCKPLYMPLQTCKHLLPIKVSFMNQQKINQKKLHEFVSTVMHEAPSTYQSVIGMVYSLIEDKRLISLDKLLKENYPEYYQTTQQK